MLTKVIVNLLRYTTILALISMYFYHCDYLYYKEYRAIRKELRKVNGIEILEFEVGNPDITAEEMYTTIRINNDVETMFFLDLKDFNGSGYGLTLENFGDWEFENLYCVHGKSYFYGWIDGSVFIGPTGEFAKKVNLEINTVQQLVREYKEVQNLVDLIPEYPKIGMFNTSFGEDDNAILFFYKYNKGAIKPEIKVIDCDSLIRMSENWNIE